MKTSAATTKFFSDFRRLSDPQRAKDSSRFFKTGKGEYGEGDQFLGIRVPMIRQQIPRYRDLSLNDTLIILKSKYHEERLFALLLLVDQFQSGNDSQKKQIYSKYLANIDHINNWDLVDSSAHLIVGAYMYDRDVQPLYKLARSKNLWARRIAVISTFYFIKQDDYVIALEIAAMLLKDPEDLIHKAVGWMLREIGNRDKQAEVEFLQQHYRSMPRTMLRYAIEKFPQAERQAFLKGKIG